MLVRPPDSEKGDVIGASGLGCQNLQASQVDHLDREPGVEHVMMQAAVLEVFLAAKPEAFAVARQRVQRQVVQLEDLRKVSEIVLIRVALEILQQVLQPGDRPAVVEGRLLVGEHQEQGAFRPQDALAFVQGLERVGAVLEHLRGQHEVIRSRRRKAQRGGFAKKLPAGWAPAVISEALTGVDPPAPGGLVAEVAIVDARGQRVHGKQPTTPENPARTAQLEPDPLLEEIAEPGETAEPARQQPANLPAYPARISQRAHLVSDIECHVTDRTHSLRARATFPLKSYLADKMASLELPKSFVFRRVNRFMSTTAIERSEICAIVVTYFPKAGCADNLAALAPQVGKLLIVDNGSSAESFAPVEAAARQLGAVVVRHGSNLGIATALNTGLTYAREHGFRWLATFDQDSSSTPGMIAEMARAFAACPQPERVAIVAPCHVERRLGLTVRDGATEASGDGWNLVLCAMTSGNLLNVAIASATGGFDDSLFIDYVDHELCLRLRRHGYWILEATRAKLLHSLGSMERRQFLFMRVSVLNHPVVRYYYRSRNRLIVWQRYWRQEPSWVIRDIRRFLFETLYVVLYEKHKGAKLPMILRGVRDGTRGVRGPLQPGG